MKKLILIIAIMFLAGCSSKEEKLEKEMTKLVTEYYEANIKGKVIGVNRHEVTIEAIKEKGHMNIEGLKGCDMKVSKAYVIIKNPQEKDPKKIKYTVENHLKCDKYETKQN